MDNDGCKIEEKLIEIHAWAHACLDKLNTKELHDAHAIGHTILNMLNEMKASNPVKFLAMFEVLSVGADVLDNDVSCIRSSDTATLN